MDEAWEFGFGVGPQGEPVSVVGKEDAILADVCGYGEIVYLSFDFPFGGIIVEGSTIFDLDY